MRIFRTIVQNTFLSLWEIYLTREISVRNLDLWDWVNVSPCRLCHELNSKSNSLGLVRWWYCKNVLGKNPMEIDECNMMVKVNIDDNDFEYRLDWCRFDSFSNIWCMERYKNQVVQSHQIRRQSIDLTRIEDMLCEGMDIGKWEEYTRFSKNNRRWAILVEDTHNESVSLFDCRVCLEEMKNWSVWMKYQPKVSIDRYRAHIEIDLRSNGQSQFIGIQ